MNHEQQTMQLLSLTWLLLDLKKQHPERVRFVIDPDTVRMVNRHLTSGTERYLVHLFGHGFVLVLLQHYEETEQYERCAGLRDAILQHNQYANDSLKTR